MSGSGGIAQTLPELLGRAAVEHGDRTAIIFDSERFTYSHLEIEVRSLAAALDAIGVTKASHVGLLMENRPEWIALYFAVTGLGAVLVPLSTFSTEDDLAYYLDHADITHLITVDSFLSHDYIGALNSLIPELDEPRERETLSKRFPGLQAVVVMADRVPTGATAWEEFRSLGKSGGGGSSYGCALPDDECLILYTSGTTARPKGAVHVHSAVAGNGCRIGDYQGLEADDVVWFYFPLFFSAGCINVTLGTLSHGASLILQPVFEPGEALEVIEREGATTWHLWPHTFKKLIGHADWQVRDHSKLHKGTGPFDIAVGKAPDGLGGVNMYGLTETCTAFTCTEAYEPMQVRLQTQGRLMAGNEIKIVDPESAEPLGPGTEGEIRVKGPAVLRRYHKVDPADTFDQDGYFITGDLGFIDEDARLHFIQRLKDVIKSGGINISPAEIEGFLSSMPGVDEAHVFGLPSADKGEVVGAALVPRAGATVDTESIMNACNEKLAAYKRPAALLVVDPGGLPMTASGKVQKFALREELMKQVGAEASR